MMTIIKNMRELPTDVLRCSAVSETEATKKATQYQSAWFYPAAKETGYLYILNSEYEEKQKEKA